MKIIKNFLWKRNVENRFKKAYDAYHLNLAKFHGVEHESIKTAISSINFFLHHTGNKDRAEIELEILEKKVDYGIIRVDGSGANCRKFF